MIKIALICGGPSLERGISLNSARSVLDHLPSDLIEVFPIYVDLDCHFYKISRAALYSNTPADFDFKLNETASFLDKEDLILYLKEMDLVFPVIHGKFGDDGDLQQILEEHNIPFIGSSSTSCKQMFYKHIAQKKLSEHGFFTLPYITLGAGESLLFSKISEFFKYHNLKKAIVKPVASGSSIGVCPVKDPKEALKKALDIFAKGIDNRVMIEPFCRGKEFTVVVFENENGDPVALLPTEAELVDKENTILDYRKKYLPSTQVYYHTPARFEPAILKKIREKASNIFTLFEAKDFVRMDGWVLENGRVYFSDINPFSGLEQNSYLFRQSSLIGMTHSSTLLYIVKNACRRYKIPFFDLKERLLQQKKDPVFVLFGGSNSERQVSLMSGANVWLKLLSSSRYTPYPFFMDVDNLIWKLPYAAILNHSVEDLCAYCKNFSSEQDDHSELITNVQKELSLPLSPTPPPESFSFNDFIALAKQQNAFVFIALHGDKGENGHLQSLLEEQNILFNGSGSSGSALCMDKFLTGQAINSANIEKLSSLPKIVLETNKILTYSEEDFNMLWEDLIQKTSHLCFIIKPVRDGCSAGIVCLKDAKQLMHYFSLIKNKALYIPPHTFERQEQIVELSTHASDAFLIEPYIQVDKIQIDHHKLVHKVLNGWIELTVGVLEQGGEYHSFNPSISLSDGAVLSLEEKFQGGTGVNITPPPPSILNADDLKLIKDLTEKTAGILGITNYGRIDIFYNHLSKKVIVIEANSLPGLTPSTVIYHQALCEDPPLYPRDFIEKLIVMKKAETYTAYYQSL